MQVADWGKTELSIALRDAMLKVYAKPFVSVEEHLQFLLDACQTALHGDVRASIWVFEQGRQRLCMRASGTKNGSVASGLATFIERHQCPHYFDALQQNFTVDAHDAYNDPRTIELTDWYLRPQQITSLLDAPIRALGAQIGVLCVEHTGPQRRWELAEQSFAAGIASQISLALERDELSQANRSLVQRVLFDALTGLPNALYLDDHLNQSLGELMRGGPSVALVYADIEQFLLICNSLGQSLAQGLLCALADRLRSLIGERGMVFRAGDDDFAIVVCDQDAPAICKRIAQQLIDVMREPLISESREIVCSLSVGYTLRTPEDGDLNSESMLREGWSASRAARRTGQIKEFGRAMLVRVALEVELEQELRKALRESQFEPHFQPILDCKSGQIYAFEALLRWRHPERGVVTPAEFIAVAQRSGLIVPLGRALFDRTMREFKQFLKSMPGRDFDVHFNLSSIEFLRTGIIEDISQVLERYEIAPARVVIEITESVIIEDLMRAQANVQALHQIGVRVQLDDFGTGYSSLNYLRVLTVDSIKLDQQFVHDLERNPRSVALIRALAGLSHDLGQEPIAEGVEWPEQLLQLIGLGVQCFQGFLISPSIPATELTPRWVAEIEAKLRKILQSDLFQIRT